MALQFFSFLKNSNNLGIRSEFSQFIVFDSCRIKPFEDIYLEKADLEAAEAARLIVKSILNKNLS